MNPSDNNNSGLDEKAGQLVISLLFWLVSLSSGNFGVSQNSGADAKGRRGFMQKGLAGLLALGAMGSPFAIARLLAPAAPLPFDPKTAEKAKRNVLMRLSRNVRRPPGAIKEDADFVEACIGCGLCGEVCPPRCIKFHAREGGHNVNTPYIQTDERACILCNKCMEVCPTNALTLVPRAKIDMGIAQIDRAACYPWVDHGICGACVAICPMGKKAISFKSWNQYRPLVHDACVGCGLCVEICPHPSTPIWIVDRDQGTVAKHRV